MIDHIHDWELHVEEVGHCYHIYAECRGIEYEDDRSVLLNCGARLEIDEIEAILNHCERVSRCCS